MPDEETKPVKPELILDSQTVLAIAQALQHVHDLEEVESGRMTVAGTGTMTGRSP